MHSRHAAMAAVLFCIATLPTIGLEAQTNSPRFALVIGNSEYTGMPRLRNPVNDAREVSRTLGMLGYQVASIYDGTRKQMNQAIMSFRESLSSDRQSEGFFYFAGHGVQANGVNYLIPVGADIRSEADLGDESVSLERVLGSLEEARNRVNVVVLDACRDNPLPSSSRSAARGLAVVASAPPQTVVLFSTAQNQTAADGDGRNSPFAAALVKYLPEAGDISHTIRLVTAEVKRTTGFAQTPFQYSSIDFDYELNRNAAANAVPVKTPVPNAAAVNEAKSTPIKLGGVWPLSDISGDQGSKAAQLAVKEINAAGGVLGRKLELIVVDDEMKPEKGAAALEKLATVDKVDIFLGGMSSGVHLGQIPVLKKLKKLTLWTGAAASAACEKGIGADADWYFHLHPWDYQQGSSYTDGWKAIAAKVPAVKTAKWFLAYEEGPFGAGSFASSKALYATLGSMDGESFKSAVGGGGDYNAVLQHAKQANPDVFIWAGYDADALPLMEQSKAIDFAPPLYIGAPPGWPADFGKSPLADGVVLYGMWAPSMGNASPASKHFLEAYVKEYGKEPATYFAPLSYSAVFILKEAIERAGTMDQAALIKAMERTRYESAVGETVTFTPSAVIKHQGIGRQKILQWQNGVQQVIWPFEVKTAEILYPFKGWKSR